jgi:hypothetical protein
VGSTDTIQYDMEKKSECNVHYSGIKSVGKINVPITKRSNMMPNYSIAYALL